MATIIEVRSLSKKYKIYSSPKKRLMEVLHPARKKMHEELWALQDVSFSIKKGESVGIIGVNGSGKSTLLQTVCGVLKPTTGSCSVNGRITALLELGSGFSLESTGKENVFLQGAMLGFSYKEMENFFPAIEKFADIGEFIYRPVKQYSSGMLVRLAISVAFQLHPDVLIVDEALSVGDIFFQTKCISKLQEMRQNGVTLLFVSHDMGTVRMLCDRAIFLDHGKLKYDGPSVTAIETYHAIRAQQLGAVEINDFEAPQAAETSNPPNKTTSSHDEAPTHGEDIPVSSAEKPASDSTDTAKQHRMMIERYGNAKGQLTSYSINGQERCAEALIESGGILDVTLEFSITDYIYKPFAAIMLRTWRGSELFGNNTTFAKTPLEPARPGKKIKVHFSQRIHLNNGQFLLTLTLAEWGEGGEVVYVDRRVNAVMIIVHNGPYPYAGLCNMEGRVVVER